MMILSDADTYTEDAVEVEDVTLIDNAELIVYNDDHNTFDWVIKCFMEICKHSMAQAEQLSLIVHYKGRAVVKVGSFDTLRPMKDALVDRGLSAVIETYQERL